MLVSDNIKPPIVMAPVDAIFRLDQRERVADFKQSHAGDWGGAECLLQKRPACIVEDEATPIVNLVSCHYCKVVFIGMVIPGVIPSSAGIGGRDERVATQTGVKTDSS